MFETTGILNDEVLKILKKYSMAPIFKKFLQVGIVISAIGALISIFISLKIFILSMFLILVFILEYYLAINIFYKKSKAVIEENTEGEGFQYKVIFNEIGAIVDNLSIGATVHLKYDSFVRLEETPDMYFLFTKSTQYIIVFKKCLSDNQINEFKLFIKEKCKNIK